MARGDKNYDKVTHGASKKGTKEKQKAVWDMIGAKKKLHEMVEALIGGDSKAAATALHDYLQQKTRAILGEHDEEMDLDLGDDEEGLERGDEFGGEEHGEEGECPECHCDPCECEDGEGEDDLGDEDLEGMGDEEHEHGERDFDEPMFGEAAATSTDASVRTHMRKLPKDAKDLEQRVKGKIAFKTKGKAKLTHPHNNAAPGLDRHVKGDIKFDTNGRAKLTKPFDNAAPGLDRKVKGKIKF